MEFLMMYGEVAWTMLDDLPIELDAVLTIHGGTEHVGNPYPVHIQGHRLACKRV